MKILESYKKIVKSMLTEHAWDRKFGEPLVTLKDVMNEAEDDKYVSIGFGRFKLKGQEDKEDAEVFVKTKDGKYVSSADQSSDDKGADNEEPKDGEDLSQGMDAPSDYERDFDDDEEAKAQAFADMEDEFDMEEETITINGKKYKEVKEEKKVTEKHILRENYERFGGK